MKQKAAHQRTPRNQFVLPTGVIRDDDCGRHNIHDHGRGDDVLHSNHARRGDDAHRTHLHNSLLHRNARVPTLPILQD